MDWLLENLLTEVLVPPVIASFRRFRFSDRAYIQCTAFLVLHTIGSHYTYSEVPVGDWARDSFGWSRNHYDRSVHFAFGALMLRPLVEMVARSGAARASARDLVLAAASIAACGTLYEILEWLVAIAVDPAAGAAFLGVQGDPWDAQKDLAVAILGSAAAAAAELGLAQAVRVELPILPHPALDRRLHGTSSTESRP